MNWESLTYKQKSDLMRIYLQNGISSLGAMKEHYNSFQNGGLKPKFNQSSEQYYDRDNDVIYAPDTVSEGYQHEYFHARPDTTLLNNLRPYYENLNDQRLLQLGADLPFVKRLNNDPNHFYSPEEIGARVTAARYMLEKAGVKNIDAEFLKNARLNELKYGDNFRDLLHMYNDENLLNIFNGQYQKGGSLGHITNLGQWKYPGEVTTIPSNNITMKGVDYPVLGISNTGDTKVMMPNLDYLFNGQYVTEYPVHKFQDGGPDDPPSWYKPLTVAGTTPETSDNTYVYNTIADSQIDRREGLPKGTTTARKAMLTKVQPVISQREMPEDTQNAINKAVRLQKIVEPVNQTLDVAENIPVVGDAITVGRAASDASQGSFTSTAMLPMMFLANKIPFGKKALKKSTDYYPEILKYIDVNRNKIDTERALGHSFTSTEIDDAEKYFEDNFNLKLSRKEISDLLHARQLDLISFSQSLNPNQRLGIVHEPRGWNTSFNLFNNSGQHIGHLAAHKQQNEPKFYISGISNRSEEIKDEAGKVIGHEERKVARDLYDMLLDVTNTPFITGQNLMNPKATMKTIMNDGYTRIERPDLKAFWWEDIGIKPVASEVTAHEIRDNNNIAKSLLFDPSILEDGKMNIDLNGGLYKSFGGKLNGRQTRQTT